MTVWPNAGSAGSWLPGAVRPRIEVVALAELASIAARVEPALLRALRLLVPGASAATEADLFFSSFVETAAPDGITLARDVLEPLRRSLASSPERLALARHAIQTIHANAPPSVRLEEELIWWGLSDDPDAPSRMDTLFKQVAATLTQDAVRADSLARWMLRAVPRLPPAAQALPGAQALHEWAATQLGQSPADSDPEGDGPRRVERGPWRALRQENRSTTHLRVAVLSDGVDLATGEIGMVELAGQDRPATTTATPNVGRDYATHDLLVAAEPPLALEIGVPHGSEPGWILVLPADAARQVRVTRLRQYDGEGRLRAQWTHVGGVAALAASSDGSLTAVCGLDGEVSVWDATVDSYTTTCWPSHPKHLAVATNSGTSWLVSASPAGVEVWSLPIGRLLKVIQTEESPLRLMAGPDTASVLVMSSNSTSVLDLSTGELTQTVVFSGPALMAVLDSDGERLAILTDDQVSIFRLSDGLLHQSAEAPDVTALAWTDDGYLWGLAPGGLQMLLGHPVTEHPSPLIAVPIPVGTAHLVRVADRLVAVAPDGSLVLADTTRGRIKTPSYEPVSPVAVTAFTDGLVVAATGAALELRTTDGVRHRLRPLPPRPLGAILDESGASFRVAAPSADLVELCLYEQGSQERRLPMQPAAGGEWHLHLPDVGPGAAYGFRASGPYDPQHGLWFNANKLLLDPYARAVDGNVEFGEHLLAFEPDSPLKANRTDSSPFVPRSVAVTTAAGNRPARRQTPMADSVFYEVHVRGATMRHPQVPPQLRGTYAGLSHPAFLEHVREIGVTALVLLPVAQFVSNQAVLDRGLSEYWGYNPINLFATHASYAATGSHCEQIAEFRAMVDTFQDSGIEVLVTVCVTHTGEGNAMGPTLCYRGLDDLGYYRHEPNTIGPDSFALPYEDITGTGNSLDLTEPTTVRLILDALRYWVEELHVGGFLFDFATRQAGFEHVFLRLPTFLDIILQDPVLREVKFIGLQSVTQMDGHEQVDFPQPWSELNERYPSTMRDFWRSHPVGLGEFATRFCGSADLYGNRHHNASVNLITTHDGFTLRDLVSYNDKHNEANGESNRDGTNDNRSWNCGAEGPTTNPDIIALRARQSRAMLATLLLSFGAPMLLGGDEMGRTQQGNNNAYCQDNEISWFDWNQTDTQLRDFTRRLIAFRRQHPVFRRRRFLAGAEAAELQWFTPAGTEMTADDWSDTAARVIGLYLDGSNDPGREEDGTLLLDDDFLVLMNAWWEPVEFSIPLTRDKAAWQVEIDTYDPSAPGSSASEGQGAGDHITVGPRTIVVLSNDHAGTRARRR